MPNTYESVTAPLGFRAAGGVFGMKTSGKPDLALIAADAPCKAAAVFTQNAIPSEPVQLGREHMKRGRCRAIVCNAGVANASTGRRGLDDARTMCETVAARLGCEPEQVLACSTGVIGQHLPMDRITPGIDDLCGKLDRSQLADADTAHAILTTDLVAKTAVRRVKIGGKSVTLGGIAKGSGMIAPNMATMLSFLTTDAAISLPRLRTALKRAVNADASFNHISVDTDTSPSDTLAILASGLAGNPAIKAEGRHEDAFTAALTDLCRDLAYQIVQDGEGATRVIRAVVEGAKSEADAAKVARAVVDSPLVKTAVHGGDPNWGRLTMAAGKSGAAIEAAKLTVKIGGVTVYDRGHPTEADPGELERVMREREVIFTLHLHMGHARCESLGCDLSREYITINADYHT